MGLAPGMVACTKRCYTRSVKELEKEQKEKDGSLTLPWKKDGKLGEEDPQNSMPVLLDWWTTHPNYDKYRGYRNNGTRKVQICQRLCGMINAILMCVRTAAGVKAKISYIEQAWRKAHNRANETGQGVKEEEGIESFEEGCLKYCMFYFMLHDVLVDRSSSRPQLTTNSLYYTSDNPNSSDTSDDHFYYSSMVEL